MAALLEFALEFARQNYNALVVLVGVSLLGAASGVIGAFAVLRRRALTGDALSHAALPGLCLAFLLLRERHMAAMLAGALASGIAGILIISALGRWTRIKDDAAIGIVLTVFFGLGIVLLKIIQNLAGVGSRAGLGSYIFGKTAGMTRGDVYVILAAAVACLAVLVLLYKEFQLVSFDGDFARSLGWPVYALDLVLMSLVAAAVVIGLPNVGVVLISALLIMPGAAARFWTDRLGRLLPLAGAFGFATGLVGTVLSARYEQLPAGPIIVLTGAALFLASLLFGRRRGALARLVQHWRFERDWRRRSLLRMLYEVEAAQRPPMRFSRAELLARWAWSPRQLDRTLQDAVTSGDVELPGPDRWTLTASGRRRAVEIARGQRLAEALLAEYPEQAVRLPLADDFAPGDVPAEIVAELTARLQAAGRWPAEAAP